MVTIVKYVKVILVQSRFTTVASCKTYYEKRVNSLVHDVLDTLTFLKLNL